MADPKDYGVLRKLLLASTILFIVYIIMYYVDLSAIITRALKSRVLRPSYNLLLAALHVIVLVIFIITIAHLSFKLSDIFSSSRSIFVESGILLPASAGIMLLRLTVIALLFIFGDSNSSNITSLKLIVIAVIPALKNGNNYYMLYVMESIITSMGFATYLIALLQWYHGFKYTELKKSNIMLWIYILSSFILTISKLICISLYYFLGKLGVDHSYAIIINGINFISSFLFLVPFTLLIMFFIFKIKEISEISALKK